MTKKNQLWVEKYRPRTLSDYVWMNENQKQQVQSWIEQGEIPHILLSGGPGCGKTTLAKVILTELGVDPSDIKYFNASNETGIDNLRNIIGFCETMPLGDFRYVLCDEADRLSVPSQDLLKNTIEEYSSVCRWIFTTNRPNKIIAPLMSRLAQGFHIESLDKEQFLTRLANILISENVNLDSDSLEILEEYATVAYPDLRKCINLLEQNCKNGKLVRPSSTGNFNSEYLVEAVSLFKQGKIHQARKLICANVTEADYENIYRLFYNNLDWWSRDEESQYKAIVIIANRLRDHALVADPEINLAAALIELSQV
jgi:DNA polymerase III delta prime subunit